MWFLLRILHQQKWMSSTFLDAAIHTVSVGGQGESCSLFFTHHLLLNSTLTTCEQQERIWRLSASKKKTNKKQNFDTATYSRIPTFKGKKYRIFSYKSMSLIRNLCDWIFNNSEFKKKLEMLCILYHILRTCSVESAWTKLWPPEVHMLRPKLLCYCIRDRTFKEGIKVKWGHKGGILLW